MNISEAEMDDTVLAEILIKFTPLVRATASRYQGRGAEFEDLVQEGFLALINLTGKCNDRHWLAAYLKQRLPGYVRAAASRMREERAKSVIVDFEDIAETIQEKDSPIRLCEYEVQDMLSRILTKEEVDLTNALIEGFTQKEIAVELGITQQAVSARVRQIKSKLEPLVASETSGLA